MTVLIRALTKTYLDLPGCVRGLSKAEGRCIIRGSSGIHGSDAA